MDGSGFKGGEVMCRYESGLKLTDKEMAKRMFNCYMHSKAHKKMLEDKKLTYYNFEFSVDPNSPNNVVFSIGFLSSLKVK
jgi:quinolinate synthase